MCQSVMSAVSIFLRLILCVLVCCLLYMPVELVCIVSVMAQRCHLISWNQNCRPTSMGLHSCGTTAMALYHWAPFCFFTVTNTDFGKILCQEFGSDVDNLRSMHRALCSITAKLSFQKVMWELAEELTLGLVFVPSTKTHPASTLLSHNNGNKAVNWCAKTRILSGITPHPHRQQTAHRD